jgi:hypothetical protein
MTEFENQIRRASLRSLPPEWREDILAAARPCCRPRRTAFLVPFRNLLWPHPAAWAVLAACWIVAAALCLSGPRGAELYTVTPPGVIPVPLSRETYVVYVSLRDEMLHDPVDEVFEVRPLEKRKL